MNPAEKSSIAVIICAAGSSRRMDGKKKEYMPLPNSKENYSVLGSAAAAFASCQHVGRILITVQEGEEEKARSFLPVELAQNRERIFFTSGGQSRRSSVHTALLHLNEYRPTHVLIHDGARPWIKLSLIEQVIQSCLLHGAVIPVLPLIETPKELSGDDKGFIKAHLRRENLCTAQTPQGFSYAEILKAHEKAAEREEKESIEYTDDAEVWGEFIGKVAVIPGDPENKKITYPGDIA